MANRFNLIRIPKLLFGAGQANELPGLLKYHGNRILVLTGLSSFRQNPEILRMFSLLDQRKFTMQFESIGREPTPSDIDGITQKYDPDSIDIVLAIGGGSVLDSGKAVSAMLPAGGSVRDYLEGVGTKTHSGAKKYFVALPTTAGTGSEATSNAVISETGANGFKKSLRHENFVPDCAVVDPVLALNCPADITASSGMDAFTQLVESYVSLKANSYTDALALDGIARIKDSLTNAVSNGTDLEARSGMAYAAFISGITLANAGLGLTHWFASSIGGFFFAPHGTICGTLMGTVNRFNITMLLQQDGISVTHNKYATLGKLFSGEHDRDLNWYMNFAADYMEILTEKLQIRRLGDFGITGQDLDRIAAVTDHKANPVKFDREQLTEILKTRL